MESLGNSDYTSASGELPDEGGSVDEFSSMEELAGKPGSDLDKDGLSHTVLESDESKIDLGNMLLDSLNNNVSMFIPEMFMEKLVQNYKDAEKLFGPTMIRALAGYDSRYVENNLRIPEFKREVEKNVMQNIEGLKKDGVLNKDGSISEEALDLAALTLAVQELDHLSAEGVIGERVHKKRNISGITEETKKFVDDSYRNINVAQSVKTAIRRRHNKLSVDDLKAFEREAKGSNNIVYAIDASGSMKGEKIAQAKRAGIALAYKAIDNGDKVGLMVFGKEVEKSLLPSRDFNELLYTITRLKSGSETDLAACVRNAMEMFPDKKGVNHLIILTDALQTVGADPTHEVLSAVSEVASTGISISVIGIALDEDGEVLAKKMVDISEGRLMLVKDVQNLDMLVLEDYSSIR